MATIPGTMTKADWPCDWLIVRSTKNGTAETATSMMMIPLTVGVNIRLSDARRETRTNCSSVDAMTRVASRPGPPSASANTDIASSGTFKFVTTSPPEPRYRNGKACRIMLRPEIASPVNVTQAR